MKHLNYHRRFLAQKWTANGNTVRVGTNGRYIADTGPHHTPASEYPAGLAKEDEAHAQFIAASPAIYAAALAVLEASQQAEESLMHTALDALADAVKEAVK
jgi:hypothetical protein